MKKALASMACVLLATSSIMFAMSDNRERVDTDTRSGERGGSIFDSSRSSTTGGVMRSGTTNNWSGSGSGSDNGGAMGTRSDTGSGIGTGSDSSSGSGSTY